MTHPDFVGLAAGITFVSVGRTVFWRSGSGRFTGSERKLRSRVSVVKICTTLAVFGSISALVLRTSIPVMLLIF